MRVVFVYQGAETIGVQALMAFLDARGHETRLVFDPATFSGQRGRDIPALARFFDSSPQQIADYILELEPDVLAFSVITGIYRWALDVAKIVRSKRKIPTVFGGMHCTATPSSVIAEEAVDAIVIGEGEEALLELVESADENGFARHDVANTWIKKNGEIFKNPVRPYITDLDALPFPKKEDYYQHMPALSRHYKIVSSRGCPHKCTYCCNDIYHQLYGKGAPHVRRRSPSNVIRELEGAKQRWNFKHVEFWDDIFTQDTRWLEEFAPLFKEKVGTSFQCYAHPIFFDDYRAKLLADAGCSLLKIGVQTIDDEVLKNTLTRPGKKDAVRRAIDSAHNAGMPVSVEHLLDLPGEGPESQAKAALFYQETRPDKIASFWLVYYPGTKIGQYARDEGIMTDSDLEAINSGSDKFLYTFMFPGKMAERQKAIKPYQTFFDALPWLPKWLAKWLIDTGLAGRLPHSGILHQALMVLNALRINEKEDLQAVRYVLSRKRKPR